MRDGRGGIAACASALAVAVFACSVGSALGGDAAHRGAAKARAPAATAPTGPLVVETVSFGDLLQAPIRVVRGPGKSASPPAQPGHAETVSFGTSDAAQV